MADTTPEDNVAAHIVIRSATSSLFVEAVRLLVLDCYPDARVEWAPWQGPEGHADGVRLEVAGTSRWMSVLRHDDSSREARWALHQGAWTLVSLDAGRAELVRALDSLLRGVDQFIPMRFALGMVIADQSPARANHTPLTRREREVLELIARGYTNPQVAKALGISVHTVRAHLASMAAKFDARTRLKLISRAGEFGYPEARPGDNSGGPP